VNFITTGLRELSLKARRQRTRLALKHEKRLLQKSEIALGREGVAEAAKFPEVRNEIVALKKLEQEQKEVAVRITKIESALKEIEAQRQENSRAMNDALGKLEEEKRPLVERRNEAKATADRCENALATVDRRLKENEAADRDLLKRVSDLQSSEPPPPDLEAQMARLSSERARLPREKAEMEQARLGSADACKSAREKLAAEEALVAEVEKKIAKVRGEFEGRDRELNENARTQQEEVRQARQQHQTVEEKKNPAYLNIGRHLASQGIAPPNSPHLLENVQRHREALARHTAHKEELARMSAQIDKQELRQFYFVVFSLLVLLAIVLPLVSQSPTKREWLPATTSAILSIDVGDLNKSGLTSKWQKEQPDIWQKVYPGLLGHATRLPILNLARDTDRVIRAFPEEQHREYILIEANKDLASALKSIGSDPTFKKSVITGLVVWERPDITIARVGPRTLAIGSLGEVENLVKVRLGIEPDLKVDAPLQNQFQALSGQNALRLASRSPEQLNEVFAPVFAKPLLQASDLLGFEMNLAAPAKGHLVIKARTETQAKELAAGLENEPTRWLTIPGSDFLLSTDPPKVEQKGTSVDLRFSIPEGAARLFLQRLARVQTASSTSP
jgi:hypothetical protein